MTTEEATKILARIWELGGMSAAAAAIEECKAQSRAWDWAQANDSMRRAYATLGASAPKAAINAIHKGTHPVQKLVD